eukprot:TRINITY_DN91512_c0_g1_i1.p1 TRINITY_DN91512_c0_g1~~TRINITY_DN91512_c0_g1_i1.p1  ORF type:complete len:407 (+),score=87.62 TRINITY_DN91512_c0_g1_i1:125-1345(+)
MAAQGGGQPVAVASAGTNTSELLDGADESWFQAAAEALQALVERFAGEVRLAGAEAVEVAADRRKKLLASAAYVACAAAEAAQDNPASSRLVLELAAQTASVVAGSRRAQDREAVDGEEDHLWRTLAWTCAALGAAHIEIFGHPSVEAAAETSRAVWRTLRATRSGQAVNAETLLAEPFPLVVHRHWLTAEDSSQLLAAVECADLWEPSPLAIPLPDAVAGHMVSGSELPRTSESALLRRASLPAEGAVIVDRLRSGAAALVGLPVSFVEPPQLVRYSIGQRYRPHMDWGNVEDLTLWVAGQRAATVLVYLGDLPAGVRGGATRFPRVGSGADGLRIVPAAGMAVAWPNVSEGGAPLFEAEHEAELLEADPATWSKAAAVMEAGGPPPQKIALNIWIRDRPLPWHC